MSLRRHAAHIDKAQPDIVKGLRERGCCVEVISKKDFPDLLVGYCGVNVLLEVKSELEPTEGKDGYLRKGKRGKLSSGQQDWHDAWSGQVATVYSLAEAWDVVQRAAGVGGRDAPV